MSAAIRSTQTSILTAVIAALVLSSAASMTQGQQYIKDPLAKDPKTGALLNSWNKVMATGESKEVLSIVQGNTQLAGNQNMLDAFIMDMFFPLFTQPEAVTGGFNNSKPGLAKMHQDFKARFLVASFTAKQMGVHDQLNKLTLKKMTDVAAQNYHPAVRYQAISMIADLHETEPQGRSAGVPLPAALPVLLSAAKNPVVPYDVRIAALAGIQKHVGVGQSANSEKKKAVSEVVRSVLAEKTPPEGRTQEQQDWMRQIAADIMVSIKEPIPEDLKVIPTAGPATAAAK